MVKLDEGNCMDKTNSFLMFRDQSFKIWSDIYPKLYKKIHTNSKNICNKIKLYLYQWIWPYGWHLCKVRIINSNFQPSTCPYLEDYDKNVYID